MAPEIVAVPTRGMERWLTQRLSVRLGATEGRFDGVCANIAFPWPRRVVGDAVAAASGVDPERDPWLPERATWPLLDVLDASLGEPWLDVVAEHLGADSDEPDPVRRARRLSVVRHAAESVRPLRAEPPGDDPGLGHRRRHGWGRRIATADVGLAGRALAPPPSPDRDPRPGRAARARLRAAAHRCRGRRSAGEAVAVRTDPAARGTPARPAGDRRRPRRPPVPAAPLARAVGRDRRCRPKQPTAAAPRRRPHHRAPVQPAARLLGPGRPRNGARARLQRKPRRPPSPDRVRRRARCWSGSRPTSEPTANRPGRRSPVHRTPASSSTRQTAASRSTRATAAHARSR